MTYIKVMEPSGTVVAVEQLEVPSYVRWQERNGIKVRCSEPRAQGILSADSSSAYQLEGREALQGVSLTAAAIDMCEYERLAGLLEQDDREAEEPSEVPPTVEPIPILSRAEMAARILALEEELVNTRALLEGRA